MRPINEIIVHCSATQPSWMDGQSTRDKAMEIRRWHMRDRGWKDIGYHWLIDRNGTVVTGRPVEQVGAHVQGHNTGTIGVCLIGGHGSAETDQFSQHFTPEQEKALRHLLADLQRRYKINKVTGHNQYAAKACPGFNVPKWLAKAPAPAKPAPAPKPAPEPAEQAPAKVHWLIALFQGLFGRKK